MPEGAIGEQFETVEQERVSFTLGMWSFLSSEVMIFGALFMVYVVMRVIWPDDFVRASRHMDIGIGTTNTAILLTSSLFMALAVRADRLRQTRQTTSWLTLTAVFGAVFVVLKFYEYADHIQHNLVPGPHFALPGLGAEMYFYLYFLITAIHALHLTLGVIMVIACAIWLRVRESRPGGAIPLELLGLYWHFVDIVWIFVYPCFYLIGNH